ncbi:MAG: hypothetical protein NZ557_05080 [Chthonomonadaceae bacterium]|nr:hypothetical protein [Chthonomonadaceae bacterium]
MTRRVSRETDRIAPVANASEDGPMFHVKRLRPFPSIPDCVAGHTGNVQGRRFT